MDQICKIKLYRNMNHYSFILFLSSNQNNPWRIENSNEFVCSKVTSIKLGGWPVKENLTRHETLILERGLEETLGEY